MEESKRRYTLAFLFLLFAAMEEMHHNPMPGIQCAILVTFLASLAPCSNAANPCLSRTDTDGMHWPNTTSGENVSLPCPVGTGEVSRLCLGGHWQTIDYTRCTYENLESIKWQLANFSGTMEDLVGWSRDILTFTSNNITLSGHVLSSHDVLIGLMEQTIENSDFHLVEEYIQNIIHSAGNLLDAVHNDLWMNIFEFLNGDICRRFVTDMEGYGKKVTDYLSRTGSSTENQEITCQTSDNLKAKYMAVSSGDVKHAFKGAAIYIPASALKEKDPYGKSGIALLMLNENTTQWITTTVASPRSDKHPAKLHSPMVSCKFFPAQPSSLNEPMMIDFALSYDIANNTCSSVSVTQPSNLWLQDGVTTANINDTYARCLTSTVYHTIYGVVEVGEYRVTLPPIITTALTICLILFFLTFVMLLYANRRLESDRATLVIFFLITLMAGYLTMVTGLYVTKNQNACRIVALILHFSQLSYSFWMLGQVVQLILKVNYKTTESGSVAQFCALGWMTPIVVVASSVGMQWEKYGREKFCTLPLNDDMSAAFIIPNVLIDVTTIICLLSVTRSYCKLRRKERKLMYRMRRILPNIRACLVVLPLLILSWSVGAVAVHKETTALDVIWSLVIIICSVCVFLLYGVFSSEVKNEYEMRYGPCCGKKHGAVQDSPRPGWRDEISQLSQIREPSSIGRDPESTTTNGALPGTSGVEVDDPGPWSPREPVGDSSASLSASVASSLALKTKLKVFPLRKTEQLSPKRRTFQETLT